MFQCRERERLFNGVDTFELHASLSQDTLDLTAGGSSRFLINRNCGFQRHALNSSTSCADPKPDRSCPGGIIVTVNPAKIFWWAHGNSQIIPDQGFDRFEPEDLALEDLSKTTRQRMRNILQWNLAGEL